MGNFSISIKSRPIKLSFFVSPQNKKYLHGVIRLNSFLWGGFYNPIIPYHKRIPKYFDNISKYTTYSHVMDGYIKAFDPDFVVSNEQNIETLLSEKRKILDFKKIEKMVEKNGIPSYGVGLYEILNYIHEKEFKFKRKHPLKIIIPQFPKQYRLFLSSVFGIVSERTREILGEYYDEDLEIEYPKVTIDNYLEILQDDKHFIRRITSTTELDIFKPDPFNRVTIFLLDAKSPIDIIDYWNLRALGFKVLPIGKQIIPNEFASQMIESIIKSSFNKDIPGTRFLKSRTMKSDEMVALISFLIEKYSSEINKMYTIQSWYPRLWDDFGRDADQANCGDIRSEFDDIELQNIDGYIRVKSLAPKIKLKHHGYLRFANDINIRMFSDSVETYAEVLPQGDYFKPYNFGFIGIGDWRMARNGFNCFFYYEKSTVTFRYPTSEMVFMEWLKSFGWEVELSDAGRIAKEMFKHLGSTWKLSFIAHKEIIHLLEKMKDERTVNYNYVRDEVKKILGPKAKNENIQYFIKNLIDTKIIELCLKVKCDVCQQYSVYTINNLNYNIQCSRCLNTFRLPTHNLSRIEWVYRTIGPFSLPKQSYGIYTVLLSLRYFSRILDRPTTPIFSFNATKDSIQLEADLALFFQEDKWNKGNPDLIFCECKTFNDFTRKDIKRMNLLIRNFPDCVIVFATLKTCFSEKEKKLLKPFVERTRRKWKNNRPQNPVLLLTANELFCDYRIYETYEKLGEPFSIHADRLKRSSIFDALCDITTQIYLDFISWSKYLGNKYSLKRNNMTNQDEK